MKKVIIILFVFMICAVFINEEKKILIPDNSIRFRVIANSNKEEDQNLKMEIKNEVEKELYKLIGTSKTIEDARIIISNHYDISYGNNFFPKKEYKGVSYDEGEHESLVITLGEGLGKNWWCVLFPPLCLLDSQENLTNVEYELYANKIINKFK